MCAPERNILIQYVFKLKNERKKEKQNPFTTDVNI